MSIISCHLMGGLGNQLFQIFATLAYSIQTSKQIKFLYSEMLTTGKARPTYWESIFYMLKKYTLSNGGGEKNSLYSLPPFHEANFRYNPIPKFMDKSLMLIGYFQSYKYFENEKTEIYKMIDLPNQMDTVRSEYAAVLNDDYHTISMHFRLGDYKDIQDRHPVMPLEYYQTALLHVITNSNVNKPFKLIYFCEKEDNDDVSKTITILTRMFDFVTFEKADDNIPDWKQMLLMSCCQDNIMANSTFSWWSAYLNQNSSKIVCYPRTWFGPTFTHDVSDLFPPSWNKIVW